MNRMLMMTQCQPALQMESNRKDMMASKERRCRYQLYKSHGVKNNDEYLNAILDTISGSLNKATGSMKENNNEKASGVAQTDLGNEVFDSPSNLVEKLTGALIVENAPTLFGIQKELSADLSARKFIVLGILNISMIYMEFKRIYEGKSLSSTRRRQTALVATVECLWAGVLAAVLFPIHLLGKIFVYKEIQSKIGVRKIGITGGASLPLHVDQFFEAIGITLLNGYGLTEMTSIYSARNTECNVMKII
eukprot:Gb_01468 [translate_table: standard]